MLQSASVNAMGIHGNRCMDRQESRKTETIKKKKKLKKKKKKEKKNAFSFSRDRKHRMVRTINLDLNETHDWNLV